MSQREFARAAVVPRGVIIDFEVSSLPPKPAYLEAIQRTLEQAGVEFTDGGQPGVKLVTVSLPKLPRRKSDRGVRLRLKRGGGDAD